MNNKWMVIPGIAAAVIMATVVLSFAKDNGDTRHEDTVNVKAGKELVITLRSNITTGYHWQLTKAVDRNFIILTGLKYVPAKTKRLGKGGKEEWTFKAVKPGTTSVSFQYVRSWEKNEPPAKVKSFRVIIK